MSNLIETIKRLLKDISLFCEHASGITLRQYQEAPAHAIVDSVIHSKGLSFVIVFPRQSGKNELQAQLEAYLMSLYSPLSAEIVKVSPTWKPQSLNAMRRLERVLAGNIITRGLKWFKEQGYIYRIGNVRIYFLSGAPTANVVGATASTLLECDEAQDVQQSKWDKEFAPMAASTNATRVFWGTAWTSKTLLSREMRAALRAEKADGIRRVFKITAKEVGEEVPSYKKFVAGEIQKHGRNHPFVRTQYFSEEIDAEGGMFSPERLRLMQGKHAAASQPAAGAVYAITIDVAGQDESATLEPSQAQLANQSRDSTALTIFEVDLSTLDDELINAPTYRTQQRHLWTGTHHTTLYAQVKDIIETWQPRYIVIDSTGIGEALAAFLQKAYPHQVIPFKFTSASKSILGWSFLSVIETARYKEHVSRETVSSGALGAGKSGAAASQGGRDETKTPPVSPSAPPYTPSAPAPPSLAEARSGRALPDYQSLFWQECDNAQMEILPGPNHLMRWSVPDGTRDPRTGELVHDDLLISASLVSLLDDLEWGVAASEVIEGYDPLSEMEY